MQSRTIYSSRKRVRVTRWISIVAIVLLLVGCESSEQRAKNREFEKVADEHSIVKKISFDGYKPTFEMQRGETTGPGGHTASVDKSWEMPQGIAFENFKKAIETIRDSGGAFTRLNCSLLSAANAVRQLDEWNTNIEVLLTENSKLSMHESYSKLRPSVSSEVANPTVDDSCPDELKALIKSTSKA